MIVDPDETLDDDVFEAALQDALDGFRLDWPLDDRVLTALDAVVDDPSAGHVAAARAAWSHSRA